MSTVPVDRLYTFPQPAVPPVPLSSTLYPETASLGLSARHALPTFDAFFDRWPNTAVGDLYSLYVGDPNTPLVSDTVSQTLGRYTWSTPGTNLPQGVVPIFAQVIRAGSQQESRSDTQNYLIKTTLPGGINPIAGSTWHSGLTMSIEGKPQGATISAADAASGMWASIPNYQNIRTNDEIKIFLGAPEVRYTVSPADAAGPGPIRIFIPPAIFPQINQFGDVSINFTVTDVVKNVSGEDGLKAQYSEPYYLISTLNPTLMQSPIFLVDTLDAPLVDLDTQSESVFTVLVPTIRTPTTPVPRNRLVVILTITRPDGTLQIERLPWVADYNRLSETVPVPEYLITPLAGGSFLVSFELQTAAGALLRQSGNYSVQVTGSPVSMPRVTVSPSEAGLIPSGQDATVYMPNYLPHDPNWQETLVLADTPANGGAIRYTEPLPAGPQGGTRVLSMATLALFASGVPFQMYYTTDDGMGTAFSFRESLRLNVQVDGRVETLPAPNVTGAVGNNLDPANVPGPAMQLTIPYNATTAGDRVDWTISGTGVEGSASGSIDITTANAGNVLPTLSFSVSRAVLEANTGLAMTITYSVKTPGSPPTILRSETLVLNVAGVPQPTLRQTWEFNTGTFEGWTPYGVYTKDLSAGVDGVGTWGSSNENFGIIMTTPIQVQAGQVYDISFSVRSLNTAASAAVYGSILQLAIDGQLIGDSVDTKLELDWKTGKAVYVAPNTSTVILGLFNHVNSGVGNDFLIDWVQVSQR